MIRALALVLFALPAAAQTVCGERGEVLNQLSRQYAESPVAIGLTKEGAVIEVLTSPTRTWTIIVTGPRGMSCVIATGEAWESVQRIKGTGL